ncbi:hypothetical protein [Brachybacterium hainanense]|uniref:Uncharacterized protein n=1 Tax=Brachybacterium hainanense TaxID=1541174 RepID=A0ABV6RCH4_9MICO
MTSSFRALRTRSRAGIAAALALPMIAGAGLIGIGLAGIQGASGETPPSQGAVLPAAGDGPARTEVPEQFFPTGPQERTAQQSASGELVVPVSELEHELAQWETLPGSADAVACTGPAPARQPADLPACVLTDGEGGTTTYHVHVAQLAGDQDGYGIFFSRGRPLDPVAAEALSYDAHAVAVYPVYEETSTSMPEVLSAEGAAATAQNVLAGNDVEGLEVIEVDGAVDLRQARAVSGTARDAFSGQEVPITLIPVVLDGEAPALVVSIPAG